MSTHLQRTERALTGLASILLAVLAWQGRELLSRVSSLEKNQTRIMVHLGIPPVANTLENGVNPGVFAASEEIKQSNRGMVPPEILHFSLDTGRWYCVGSP
jgi:hypothetical protein